MYPQSLLKIEVSLGKAWTIFWVLNIMKAGLLPYRGPTHIGFFQHWKFATLMQKKIEILFFKRLTFYSPPNNIFMNSHNISGPAACLHEPNIVIYALLAYNTRLTPRTSSCVRQIQGHIKNNKSLPACSWLYNTFVLRSFKIQY